MDRRLGHRHWASPLTLIAEAVFARCLSAQKDERVAAVEGPGGPDARSSRRPRAVHRRRRDGPLRQQDHLLRPGLRPDGGAWRRRVELDDLNNGGDRPDVARRLHHPQRLPGQDQGGVRPQPEARRTCCVDPYFAAEIEPAPGRLAAGRRGRRRRNGIPLPAMASALAYFDGYRTRPPAGQPAPGPARLLRRPHLRAHRQAARPVLPHQLDRPRRHHGQHDVQRFDLLLAVERSSGSKRRSRKRPDAVQRCTRAEPPLASASTSSSRAIVTSPGKVVSSARAPSRAAAPPPGERPVIRP